MLLFNTLNNTYHPIMYLEAPFPGSLEEQKVTRYRSKGHHTQGFSTKELAVEDINISLIPKMKEIYYVEPILDLEKCIEWNGKGIPADTQLR